MIAMVWFAAMVEVGTGATIWCVAIIAAGCICVSMGAAAIIRTGWFTAPIGLGVTEAGVGEGKRFSSTCRACISSSFRRNI